MSHDLVVGLCDPGNDPFWLQVKDALPQLLLDGAPQRPTWVTRAHGQLQSVLTVPVAAHSTHTVEVP